VTDEERDRAVGAPYVTGGGGFSLEHRYGALFMARMLSGTPLTVLGGRPPTSVAFQQAPVSPVDDLIITADASPERRMVRAVIACRRRPQLVPSNAQTSDLFVAFVAADLALEASTTESDDRIVLAVSGRQLAAQQLAELAQLARSQPDADSLFTLINDSGQYNRLRTRLGHVRELVKNAQAANRDAVTPEGRTWTLLSRLYVIEQDLEPPSDQDWVALAGDLDPLTAARTLDAGRSLRDDLAGLADEYAQTAALITQPILRRRLHDRLDHDHHRTARAWEQLNLLRKQAEAAVARGLAGSGSSTTLTLPRQRIRDELNAAISGTGDLVITGASGVGKSALVLDTVDALRSDPSFEAVTLNLRQLPATPLELATALGVPLETALLELGAPRRVVIIDAADAVAEARADMFTYIVESARAADVSVIAVAASEGAGTTAELLRGPAGGPDTVEVAGLDDDELATVGAHFPELQRLVADRRGRELLRRSVVIDLLARAGSPGAVLSEEQAAAHVWATLVRNGERAIAGQPDDREQAMQLLAAHALQPRDPDQFLPGLNAAALLGLRQSGLLRPVSALPWERVPEFTHDIVRSYAVARRLLVDRDPAGSLAAAGAPRWALPAARLACQILLGSPATAENPLAGRFELLQDGFDSLAAAGHGERWSDVPTEALLAIATPEPGLGAAWPHLRAHDGAGLQRLLRIVPVRHRPNGVLDTSVVDPLVSVLLDAGYPNGLGEAVSDLYTQWLGAHAFTWTPAGHPQRIELACQIVARCAANEAALDDAEVAAAAARAARTPEEIAADEARRKELASLVPSMGPQRRRRPRPTRLPYQWISDDSVGHLALLGPDMGDGEALLRRIADESPNDLKPAVETFFAAHALAAKDPRLLTYLTAEYYIDGDTDDDDDDGWGYGGGLHDDGIRDHEFHGISIPLAAYYKGPFLTMFRHDYVGGVACLNRMLNHGARYRVRTLQRHRWPLDDGDDDQDTDRYENQLSIAGEPRTYIGGGHVWLWYRGTGVGPYPCMSALQALEVVTDELIASGVPVTRLVPLLLNDADNLAMPALVVGLLVRHLEQAEEALDPFLVEPLVWHLEFNRSVHDRSSGLAATIPNIAAPERRSWTLREASMMLCLRAEGERLTRLVELGDQLVVNARAQYADPDAPGVQQELAAVRGWADALDRNKYELTEQDGQILVQQGPNPEVDAILGESNADLRRVHDAIGLTNRHAHLRDNGGRGPDMNAEDLAADLAVAQDLASNPPNGGLGAAPDGPSATAASALELSFDRGVAVSGDDILWSANTLLEIAEIIGQGPDDPFDHSLFSLGPDVAAARGVPFLLIPAAKALREQLEITTPEAVERFIGTNRHLACRAPNEARLTYARFLDPVWRALCATDLGGRCHHAIALELVHDSFRDSLVGPWDGEAQQVTTVLMDPPYTQQLRGALGKDINITRLCAALRALGAAATTPSCVQDTARATLEVVVGAHQRSRLAEKYGHHHSQSDSLIAARALLNQAAQGSDQPLLDYIANYLVKPEALAEALLALSAAAEERAELAATAARLWPHVMDLVLDDVVEHPSRFTTERSGFDALSELIPNAAYAHGFLTLEFSGEPIRWRRLLDWGPQVDRWIPFAQGSTRCIDALVIGVKELDANDQLQTGLPWIEQLIQPGGQACANTYTLAEWL
jgi:hypothetical protein